MAIDLFVNYERYSNNSLFYRVTSSSPFTYTVRLSDKLSPDSNLDAQYYVEYSINQTPYVQFASNLIGEFVLPVTFNTALPCVCSIAVSLTSIDSRRINSFSMQGRFLSSLPSVDFIAYPSSHIDLIAGTQTQLTSLNYLTGSKGVTFYGEGHTEVINLSSNSSSSIDQIVWLVGNDLQSIIEQKYSNSFYPITPNNGLGTTAKVSIFTQPKQEASIPINVWATNRDITTKGPVIKYDDYTGIPEFYPFFASSVTSNTEFIENNIFKSNIIVLSYPDTDARVLNNPFEVSEFMLPLDYTPKTFAASVNMNSNLFGSIVTENFINTEWEVSADVRRDSKMIGWTASTETLHGCGAYQFNLAYQTDPKSSPNLLPFYKSARDYPTTITLSVSTTKAMRINAATDWIPRDVTFVNTVTARIEAVPSSKMYSPKYFNVRGETVKFAMVNILSEPYSIQSSMLSSSKSTETMMLTTGSLTGSMSFNALGVVDLFAKTIYINKETEQVYETLFVYANVAEIIKTYDEIPDENSFQTATTPLYLPYTEQPKVTPNEWVTADVVNSIINKMYLTIQTLYDYSSIYVKKDIFYGYMMPAPKTLESFADGVINPRVLTWLDADCSDSNSLEHTTWEEYEPLVPENTWMFQSTNLNQTEDPSCFQKHCTRWNWKWRRKGKSGLDITWKQSRCKEMFAKKWKFEKCVVDTAVDCNYSSWQIVTDTKQKFIVPSSRAHALCPITDADVLYNTDHIVLARARELYIIKKNYECTFVDRTFMADDLFPFQSIVGITTTKDEKIIVLDELLPRVSVYDYDNNDIILKDSWGRYGQQQNPQGLNQPTDIHVDQYNTVWIADSGNDCVKKFTILGKPLATLTHEFFDTEGILSMCVDSLDFLHCLTSKRIVVFDSSGKYVFNYILAEEIDKPKKINICYNKEMIYVTYKLGVAKYFRTGIFSHFVMNNLICADGGYLESFNSIMQDKFRNVYVTTGDKLLQIQDIQQKVQLKAPIKPELYWSYLDLTLHKEEYIQPWIYLKSFHRLWDNIELLRSSIFYSTEESCKTYVPPTYSKEDLIIGQNEIVTNSVLNRLSEQLWTNLQSLINFYDPNCKK